MQGSDYVNVAARCHVIWFRGSDLEADYEYVIVVYRTNAMTFRVGVNGWAVAGQQPSRVSMATPTRTIAVLDRLWSKVFQVKAQ